MENMNTKVDKKNVWYWFHVVIGLGFMLGFPLLPPIEPITEIGMSVLGVFVGMVYLWSTVDSIWPSMLGLLLIALSGYLPDVQGYAAVKQVFLDAFGNETVLGVAFGMILFAGVAFVGCTKYMVKFFLSWKLIEGRPYLFLFTIMLCAYVMSGLTTPMASLLLLWPLVVELAHQLGYKKGDKIFYSLICGVHIGTTLGQPMLPFKGSAYMILSAIQEATGGVIGYSNYIIYNFTMAVIIILTFVMFVKYVLRADVEKIKSLKTEDILKEKLPPMNLQQKFMMTMCGVFIISLLLPNFLPTTLAPIAFLNSLGLLGVISISIVVLMIAQYKGKSIFDFGAIAKQSFSWNVYFLVASALYVCNAVTAEITGIKPFLIDVLQPLLGGKSDFVFIIIVLAFALITTNFANNAGMALILVPIIAAFADQYIGVNSVVLSVCMMMMVYVALLTPAASPFAGMLFSRSDLVDFEDIMKLYIPLFVATLVVYVLIGYPIATILF